MQETGAGHIPSNLQGAHGVQRSDARNAYTCSMLLVTMESTTTTKVLAKRLDSTKEFQTAVADERS